MHLRQSNNFFLRQKVPFRSIEGICNYRFSVVVHHNIQPSSSLISQSTLVSPLARGRAPIVRMSQFPFFFGRPALGGPGLCPSHVFCGLRVGSCLGRDGENHKKTSLPEMALLPPISKTTRQNFLNFCMRPQILVHMNKLC